MQRDAKRTHVPITFGIARTLVLHRASIPLRCCALERVHVSRARTWARLHARDSGTGSGDVRARKVALSDVTAVEHAAVRAAEAAAAEAAAASGLSEVTTEADAVLDELNAVELAAAAMADRDWDVNIIAVLEDMAEHPEYYVSAIGAVGGLALGGVVAGGTLAAIATVPFLADGLRVVGLGYVFWFLSKYLLSAGRRGALVAEVKAVLRDARAPPAALLDRRRANVLADSNGSPTEATSAVPVGDDKARTGPLG